MAERKPKVIKRDESEKRNAQKRRALLTALTIMIEELSPQDKRRLMRKLQAETA
jgi:hypothetical protein